MNKEVNAEKIFEEIKSDNFPIMRFSHCLYCTVLWEYFHFLVGKFSSTLTGKQLSSHYIH